MKTSRTESSVRSSIRLRPESRTSSSEQAPPPDAKPQLRVAYVGTYELQEGYPRNRFLIGALRAAGVEVVPCHRSIWRRGERSRSVWRSALAAGPRWWQAQLEIARELQLGGHFDALVLGYPGYLDLPLARRWARRRDVPLILDAFLPVAQTLCEDRGRFQRVPGFARAFRALERRILHGADHVLVDTEAHRDYFVAALGLAHEGVTALPVGSALPRGKEPAERPPGSRPGRLSALFVGTYVPLQGVKTIVEAAAALRDQDITFTLVGQGQDYSAVRALASEKRASLTFVDDWVPEAELDRWIRGADVCLGIFGETAKARRVIPCKIYDALVRGRPIVTADTPAIRELLVPGESVSVVPAGDAMELAGVLRRWIERPEALSRLGEAGRRIAEDKLRPAVVGRQFRTLVERLCATSTSAV